MLQYAAARGYGSSNETSVDPPSDASTDEELFGMKDCGSILSISSNIVMEDITKETSLINLTHTDKNDDIDIANDDTFVSKKVARNPTINKNTINFLKEIRGLIKYPITHEVMKDPLMGTDRTSYERENGYGRRQNPQHRVNLCKYIT